MPEILTRPVVQAGVLVTVLIVLSCVAFWLLAKFRDYTTHDHHSDQSLLTNLEELHRRGDIDEEEFRKVQAAAHGSTSPTSLPTSSDDSSRGDAIGDDAND